MFRASLDLSNSVCTFSSRELGIAELYTLICNKLSRRQLLPRHPTAVENFALLYCGISEQHSQYEGYKIWRQSCLILNYFNLIFYAGVAAVNFILQRKLSATSQRHGR